jgi:cation:H+ antiporter
MISGNLTSAWLIIIFIFSSIAVWVAGVKISLATDTIYKYFHLEEAMGGMIFLAIVTNLPEIAITVMAAYTNHMEIAVSNILGGIAIQTIVLTLIDGFGVGKLAPLSSKASSVGVILEGVVLTFILTLVIIGKQIPSDYVILNATPVEWIILFIWLAGLYLIYKNPTLKKLTSNESLPLNFFKEKTKKETDQINIEKKKVYKSLFIFSFCAVTTLISGIFLETSSEELANRFHISGAIFGATILAVVTSLPEISTGIASAKIKDYQMAVSDIIGGNAFLPVLLLLGSITSGKSIMNIVGPVDIYLTGLAILLTGTYMVGLIIKSDRQLLRLGYDSIAILLLYLIGIWGMQFVK